jgi:Fe-S cluster assembly ATPase SufC
MDDLFSLNHFFADEWRIISFQAPIPLGFRGWAWAELDLNNLRRYPKPKQRIASRNAIIQSIKTLKKEFKIKSKNSYLLGFSQGAAFTLFSGLTSPSEFNGLIAICGFYKVEEDIILAAKQSQCDEFISSMKDGYDTLIGERGQRLSGGQRQRLAIARAIVRNPDILIFDEATSSVDNRTERLIQKSFFDLKKNRTMIIVAHRLSTIRNCDNIFVIKDSKIHESGTHDELMKNNISFYAELWNIQTGKKI